MTRNEKDSVSEIIVEQIIHDKETPVLILSTDIIQSKYHQFCEALPESKIYYAVKANPNPDIVKLLYELGSGFEIASEGELNLLLQLGVSPSRIISSNPVKTPSFIKNAYTSDIKYFVLDSHSEIAKLSQLAPESKVYIRLTVPNDGSEWPLDRKFGVEINDAIELLVESKEANLKPHGIAFHVGSQCTNPNAWTNAIEKSKVVWESVKSKGIELKSINIGGGFPCEYTKPVSSIVEISQVIRRSLTMNFPPEVEVLAEPGRALVGEAGTLISTVIGKAMHDERPWFYLDVGVFNGLMEAIGGIKYKITTPKIGTNRKCVLAGPSCDSMDIISEDIELPELDIGDIVTIMSTGAYTTCYASQFDGFRIPDTYMSHEELI